MNVGQYLEWAERQPAGRYELVDGVPQRMSPELNRHLLVKSATYRAFHEALRASSVDYLVLPDGGTVVIDDFKTREPDLAVVGGGSLDLDSVQIGEPVIIVQVTSPSSVRTDTGDKLIEYFSLAGVRHYLLVHPSEQKVVHHRRDDQGKIETSIVSEGTLSFDPPGFSVEVSRFFEDLPRVGKAN
jgi:Uma2 family endonuclease